MKNPYAPIVETLLKHGTNACFQSEHQLVISRQTGPVWPDAGNSFWITWKLGTWYLCTWSPICYQLPADSDVAGLCVAFMTIGDKAQRAVPTDLIVKYGLKELEYEEASALFGWDDSDEVID